MKIDLVESLLGITMLGTEWILWLLVGLSVYTLGIILERSYFFYNMRINFAAFSTSLADLLTEGKIADAIALCKTSKALEAQVAQVGLSNISKGPKATEGSMEGVVYGQKQTMDRGLVVLGTLGNNAPFIGLFGTVIGIIQAFQSLSLNPEGGPSMIMRGISEALIATAVGLIVAIPAVIAFNAFNRIVKNHISNSQALIKVIMTFQK